MATDSFEGVLDQILLKTAKNDSFLTHFFKFAPLPSPHFEDNRIFVTFHLFLCLLN